jgi:hypothetical protein
MGKLVVERWQQKIIKSGEQWVKRIFWMCRCDCGKQREVPSSQMGKQPPLSCVGCTIDSSRQKISALQRQRVRAPLPKRETSPYMLHYERYRKGFTTEQRARYEEVMGGRRGERLEQEAVDVVMREPVPGVCCERCLRGEPTPPEPSDEEAEEQAA